MGSFTTVSDANDLILFDGVCNLCNGAVQFIIKRDSSRHFTFASLQSSAAKDRLQRAGATPGMETIVLISEGRVFYKSNAALEIARNLSGGWPVLYVFKIVPRFIRDAIYDWVAKNRYRFFGKREACMIPTPELKSRFLSEGY